MVYTVNSVIIVMIFFYFCFKYKAAFVCFFQLIHKIENLRNASTESKKSKTR